LVSQTPTGEGWINEIKYDGYRTLIVIDQGKVRAFSRHGRDWTGPYSRVVDAAAKLSCQAALLDGEIIVQDANGISDSDALRSAIHKAPHRIVFFLSISCIRTARIYGGHHSSRGGQRSGS
jgi:bifunctional non-homologous end joining protein LigD